jgi:transcriptional regulator NrdR family protein
MTTKKGRAAKRHTVKKIRSRSITPMNKKRTAATKKKKKFATNIRRSSGRKEKFDVDRMSQTTSRSGVPFMMARDIAKNVSKKIESEAKDSNREKTVSAGRVRKMITQELQNRNEQATASSYAGEMPANAQKDNAALKITGQYTSPIGTADTNQHEVYRADRDSVLHDKSKQNMSSS